MTALNEQALEAAAKAMCHNPYECVMGSGSITVGGESSFECHRYAWQDQLGRAEAAIRAYMAALDPLPSSCSISVQHGVVTAAYDNDEDAMRVFKLLGDHHGA